LYDCDSLSVNSYQPLPGIKQLEHLFIVYNDNVSTEEDTQMKKTTLLLILIGFVFILAACTAGPNQLRNTPNSDGDVAGFWMGIWHGLISPITFVLSLFNKSINVFEVHNNGGWYIFGFLFGASMIYGGSGSGAAYRRRNRD